MKANNTKEYTFIVSLSGLSLILFLTIHLCINLLVIIDKNAYNQATYFMQHNPVAQTTENVLALGFLVHIVLTSHKAISDLKNKKNRDNKKLASKDMLIMGGLIICFLTMHLIQFWSKANMNILQTKVNGVVMNDTYTFVCELFTSSLFYCIAYIATGIVLGLHMRNGFQSALSSSQSEKTELNRNIRLISSGIGFFFMIGFSSIPLFFLLKKLLFQ